MSEASLIDQAKEFLLNAPLYEPVTGELAEQVAYFNQNFDCYCLACANSSVFRRANIDTSMSTAWRIVFLCTRCEQQRIYFILRRQDEITLKIGQFPSLADLQFPELKKYSRLLGKEYSQQFAKAVGLATHGVGIGSFVYLRRIFEKLIEDAHQDASREDGWDEASYCSGYMAERVQALAAHLPEFLVENKVIYSVLSKGVHELSEQECLAAFPVVKTAIELILDEHLERDARKKKMDAAKSALAALSSSTK
ncbi:short-chain dehydrogenase [Pseudomonas sp. PDM20]|uniref:short-chain dehydrogenase n=1 Tax=Pseudomonas sp. PDM20 TaxID=2769254 RepID=UPI001786C553|nr:short-chain dehydrogenase [Pseudomonas sp. PDM20]MBD9681434.1 short-chain dehydrogenase [Pseudomonas sp. PDM20]